MQVKLLESFLDEDLVRLIRVEMADGNLMSIAFKLSAQVINLSEKAKL